MSPPRVSSRRGTVGLDQLLAVDDHLVDLRRELQRLVLAEQNRQPWVASPGLAEHIHRTLRRRGTP